ncbi:hypothetical protein C475_02051 [Halosimplex carlsbadense 2-9-1]|uniref:Halobacterial output domain-containing protein n=1 Tax=Halosimplex carlsbadense 2-9-1 TaxID=797114 RepID=M0D2E5_9EURY|nr:HalOD1 output domain-containing protein [Halosimplex carlsbadense]ELZ29691.1 hypothetical protein C475_02051 [Halosimplex carlsbadense 2-9-1]
MYDIDSTTRGGGSDCRSVVAHVVTALAHAEGVEPERLDTCLADHIDADALEELYARSRAETADVTVRFAVEGYEVVVGGPGDIRVSR